ncbi:hypothetical protein ABZ281_00115 [Streptomyces sp. NPDC006265]|uniref:hypothetical protein n=1 Tax=Streptomyces sp. NPDC006265 TaxID=3156740 RepID=UPI0033A9D44A
MGRLTRRRRLISAVLTVIAYGSAAGAGALLALITVGALKWSPILLAVLATTAFSFIIAAEVVESPQKGPKHAAR